MAKKEAAKIVAKKAKKSGPAKKRKNKSDNSKKGSIPHNSKIVINIETGIFYDSIRHDELAHDIKVDSLRKKMRIKTRNKTNLRYA